MFNPPPSYPSSDSYDDLLKRMTRRARETKIDHRILGLLQQFFENELTQQNIVLSRPERNRLYQDISKAVLADVLGNMGGTK
jgi:hypothetical protein